MRLAKFNRGAYSAALWIIGWAMANGAHDWLDWLVGGFVTIALWMIVNDDTQPAANPGGPDA